MRVLDLFSGLGGWSSAFRDRYGYSVFTVDRDRRFSPDWVMDVMDISPSRLRGRWHLILASPPCEAFSVAAISRHWVESGVPRTDAAIEAMALVERTVSLIEDLAPDHWILENPMGMLRKLPFMQRHERRHVTLCQYGDFRMKPTDLWGIFPPAFEARACKRRSPCHESAPRGSPRGTQRYKDAADKAKLPYGLSDAVRVALERAY